MAAFTEVNYKGFVVYNYSMRVVNRLKNGGKRNCMKFCIAQPNGNATVKGNTIVSGFSSEAEAIAFIESGEVFKWCKAAA